MRNLTLLASRSFGTLAGPALALSCMAPDVVTTYNDVAAVSEQRYIMSCTARSSFDEGRTARG